MLAAFDAPPKPRIVIVGSGFSGLCMGIRLKQAGIDTFTILEKAGALGGTWRDNDYPGAACDVQSHLYSFSFELNPRWSRMFAEQGEIRSYLEYCAEKYALVPHLRFNREVERTVFDEASSTWTVTLAGGEQMIADLLIIATGGLSRPAYPDIVGIQRFAGKIFHSARWDHSYDFAGKRVGVIGTGASSIQFVPQIAPRVQELAVFQRTPPWILPKPDRRISGREQRLYRLFPFLQWLYRVLLYWLLETRVLGFVVSPKLMLLVQKAALEFLTTSVPDPVLQKKLLPAYTFGCKRVLISNDYYPALLRSNVEVVDAGISEITENQVITRDGRGFELDALILGTGFRASEDAAPFEVRGKGGVDLNEHWKDGARAYLGTTVAGFPNFFMISGPNTGLGHSSLVLMIESQVAHIMSAIRAFRKLRACTIEVRREVEAIYNRHLQTRLERSVWASGCSSWYRTRTGRNTTLWPHFTFVFRLLTRRAKVDDFCFTPASSAAPQLLPPATRPRVGAVNASIS
jgi:cation diffusion facilitator CzcD-associated flavoprotein CzcO